MSRETWKLPEEWAEQGHPMDEDLRVAKTAQWRCTILALFLASPFVVNAIFQPAAGSTFADIVFIGMAFNAVILIAILPIIFLFFCVKDQ